MLVTKGTKYDWDEFQHCNHIKPDSKLRLQSYFVPFMTYLAILFGPNNNGYYNHILSLS